MKAVVIKAQGVPGLVDIKEQEMRSGYVRVKTVAVAVNPTDFHHACGVGPVGHILGCDLSGIVEEVGPDCTTTVKKGDRVFGVAHCANTNNSEDGAFAEYAMVRDGHLAPIPDSMSFEEAATLGVGITSVGQALYMEMGLPLSVLGSGAGDKEEVEVKKQSEKFILIYGGSTATGTLAIQFAKLSGFTPVVTASPKHIPLLESLSVPTTHIFDYHDPQCGLKIREFTRSSLQHVFDTISTPSSFAICADAFPPPSPNSSNLQFVGLLPTDAFPRKDVIARSILAYRTFGERFEKFGKVYPADKKVWQFGCMFWALAAGLLEEGKVRPHPVIIGEGGLKGLCQGIVDIGTGKISGGKLVYKVADTPDVLYTEGDGNESGMEKPKFGTW